MSAVEAAGEPGGGIGEVRRPGAVSQGGHYGPVGEVPRVHVICGQDLAALASLAGKRALKLAAEALGRQQPQGRVGQRGDAGPCLSRHLCEAASKVEPAAASNYSVNLIIAICLPGSVGCARPQSAQFGQAKPVQAADIGEAPAGIEAQPPDGKRPDAVIGIGIPRGIRSARAGAAQFGDIVPVLPPTDVKPPAT